MRLTDPREALADQSSFIGYLLGLAGLGDAVRALAADGAGRGDACSADDFVFLLLGLAGLGAGIERLARSAAVQQHSTACGQPPASTTARWLR